MSLSDPQLVQSCAAPPSGAQYPPTVLCGAAPSSPFVVDPSPGPLLPLMTFRSNTEAVTLGKEASVDVDARQKKVIDAQLSFQFFRFMLWEFKRLFITESEIKSGHHTAFT